jgi:hypothetical protein
MRRSENFRRGGPVCPPSPQDEPAKQSYCLGITVGMGVSPVPTQADPRGAELQGWYFLLGRFDEACILDAPNYATVARIALAVAERHSVKTETLRPSLSLPP